MDDAREALSEIDRALAGALDVDVSPDFMARVRRRVANEPMRAPFWHAWRFALPIAAAALVVVAAGVSMLSTRRPAAAPVLAPASSSRIPAVQPTQAAVAPPSPAAVTARVRTAGSRPAAHAPGRTEPEVLVPREEIEMYRRLMARAGSTPRPVFLEARDIVPTGTISEITIDPIRIELIIPPVGGEGDRQ